MSYNLNNLVLFFDGCHKIYYAKADDKATIDNMVDNGYAIYRDNFSKDLAELWRDSCSLRFVSPADLDFSQPHINQFEARAMRGFRTRLKNYFAMQEGIKLSDIKLPEEKEGE